MAGETITLSGMTRAPQAVNGSDLLFITKNEGTEKDSYAVSASDLQSFIFKETAYASTTLGLAATNNNDIFYVYTDDTQYFVNGYTNKNGVASVILNADSTVRIYPTNFYFSSIPSNSKDNEQINSISDLANTTPSFVGQRVYLKGRISDLSTTVTKLPWGGGYFIAVSAAIFTGVTPDGSTIISAGEYVWIREELIKAETAGTIYAEWFSDVEPTLLQDWSTALNAANKAAATLASLHNARFGRLVRIVMPPLWGLSKSVIININQVWLDGNGGSCLVNGAGSYAAHPQGTATASVSSFVYAIGLISSITDSKGNQSTCYFDRPMVRNLSLSYSAAAGTDPYVLPYTEHGSTLETNPIMAFCHIGVGSSTTIQTAQGDFRNVAVNGFPVGYCNGNYAWGVDFYECKWTGCYYSQFLIAGTDNGERYNFFGNVWQNGYHGIWSDSWPADCLVSGGSMVWMKGIYFYAAPGAPIIFNIQLSRLEYVVSSSPIMKLGDAGYVATNVYPNYVHHTFKPTLLVLSATSNKTDAITLFSIGKFHTVDVTTNWNWNSFSYTPNLLLTDNTTAGNIVWEGNTMKVGLFTQPASWPLSASRVLSTPTDWANTTTTSGANSDFTTTIDTTNNLYKVDCVTTNTGSFFHEINIPIDFPLTLRNTNITPFIECDTLKVDSSWLLVFYFTNSKLGSSYDFKVGDMQLSDFTSNPGKVAPLLYGWPKTYPNLTDLPFIPDGVRVQVYISGTGGNTAGNAIYIKRAGILAF